MPTTSEVIGNSHQSPNPKVLAILTGGTIFMKRDEDNQYVPADVTEILNPKNFSGYLMKQNSDSRNIYSLKVRENNADAFIEVEVVSLEKLKDSSEMVFEDWNLIGKVIENNYKEFDGFVVLYGTDTMTQAACSLSFMLENLSKPVVFTGSQIPIFEARNDGWNNFISSTIIAGISKIPEVLICFNNKVFRGNRCVKVDSRNFDAFESPCLEPLAVLGVEIDYNSHLFQPAGAGQFRLVPMMSTNILTLTLNPSTDPENIQSVMTESVQGVLVRGYGCGNGPITVGDRLRRFAEEKVIVVVSQCLHTKVECAYKTGLVQDETIVSGNDLTPEAAFAKLSYLMTKYPGDVQRQRELMTTCMRGEMSVT